MTLSSLRGIENQITELRQLLSSDPQSDEARAFLASLTAEELDLMSEIFIWHEHADDRFYENVTAEELAFGPVVQTREPAIADRSQRTPLPVL